jgi:hypothetical protein
VSHHGREEEEGGGAEAARVFGKICSHCDTVRAAGRCDNGDCWRR